MNQSEKMERPSYLSSPSFWKLLMEEDFNHGIRIPHSFSNHLERRKSPCNYYIITEDKKGSSDRSWRAKLVKKDQYFYLCKKSWPQFVRYHSLKYGDVLLFHLVDKTTFRVTPYSANGSIKKLDDDDDSPSESDEGDEDDGVRASTEHRHHRKLHRMDKRGGSTPMLKKARKSSDFKVYKTEETDSGDEDDEPREGPRIAGRKLYGKVYGGPNREVDENSRDQIQKIKTADEALKWDHYYDLGVAKPYFIRAVKAGHMYTMVVPKPFALAMELNKVGEVGLQWEEDSVELKRSWIAKMFVDRNAGKGRIDIGKGWSDFRKRFKIGVGDICRFTISNRSDPITISVHVFRSGDHKSRN